MSEFKLGLDIGSTTIKVVLLEDEKIVHSEYKRHHSDVSGLLNDLLKDLEKEFPGLKTKITITGSGGLSVANWLKLDFVQEVMAETVAINKYHPQTDVIIELGGEDAKITYMHPVLEQRMNGTCAGGTGAFIDQMAQLLQTDADGLNNFAKDYRSLYTIASRCGVFAKSDLQPLINEGAAKEDLAASIYQSVVNQTIAGLACGRPIRGHVAFLGGPLFFNSELRAAFERTLKDNVESFWMPDEAQIYVALGAALSAKGEDVDLNDLIERFKNKEGFTPDIIRIDPLFKDEEEKRKFDERHAKDMIEIHNFNDQKGPMFLGIDAGSTTTKAVVINEKGELCYTFYAGNKGNPVMSAVNILKDIYKQMPKDCYISYSCVTGYGENIIKAALGVDIGEIETMAHFQSAKFFCPDVDFIIDIGGQDMKCMRIRNGVIDSIMLNEACSSGCGSFIQTFAQTLEMDAHSFSIEALKAENPVDLGTRCTVFMNSKVKQAQKEGASVGDISAGLSYSVVRNALYKVIKIRDTEQLGKNIVVQGGTFLNDAILRCFELVSKRDVIRPNVAGLMGAFGAALIAAKRCPDKVWKSGLLDEENLDKFSMTTENTRCEGCANHCKLTISTFSNGRKFVSGNRCERGEGKVETEIKEKLPNMFKFKYERTFSYYKPTPEKDAPRGVIGIPRALNQYENYPFWFTVLTKLGFCVKISARSTHALFERGMDTIPSESVCYPAKLVHGHIENLISRGITTIFYPDVPYERHENRNSGNHYNCPIVCSYPEVIKNNVEDLKEKEIRYLNPFFSLDNMQNTAMKLVEVFSYCGVTKEEAMAAVKAGEEEHRKFKEDIRNEGLRVIKYLDENNKKGIVLAGRPYHTDPEIHHGIPDMINSLGLAVLTEDSVAVPGTLARPIRVVDQWMYHSRLYEAAAFVITKPNLELVQLTSFGCGLDAVTADQVQEILETSGKLYTLLKIDEVSNLGAARIRMRSLVVAMDEREEGQRSDYASAMEKVDKVQDSYLLKRVEFTKENKKTHTILAPQMAPITFDLVEAAFHNSEYRLKILKQATRDDIECGLKYVNNDACYPSIIVVGQMINAIEKGEIDPDNVTLAITQTGGGCRATNYVAFLRKALKEAGYPNIPVIAMSVQGFEKNSGFNVRPKLLHDAIKGLALGDMISTMLYRVRPYELVPGSANALYSYINRIGRNMINRAGFEDKISPRYDEVMPNSYFSKTPEEKKKIRDILADIDVDMENLPEIKSYKKFIRFAVDKFNRLPLRDIPRKPRVGLVGEILVKFQPDANNNAIDVIEQEGCEGVLPGVLDFFLYCCHNPIWAAENIGKSKKSAFANQQIINFLELYRKPINEEFKKTGKFMLSERIEELAKKSASILSCGNFCGEGWFLTAEMVELIQDGVPNIICAQPFACLPNHVTGKGMIKELRRQYPQSNIIPIDYDPGASEANQLNRIKLMISTAHMQHEKAQENKDV